LVEVSCKRCAGAAFVKNGTVRGHQRYLCKACGRNFTATPERGKPEAMKALAVLLYAMGNASQGMIAKLLGVSHVTVYRWLRAAGEAAPEPVERGRADRRDVARRGREKNKVRLWRAYDPVARRTLAWELGGRDDATCRRLLDKVGIEGRIFLTDDWEGFHRLIPAEQLFTGKDLTFPIEQDNSDVRHYLARFRRRSKVTSRARHMVDSSLRLLHHLMQPENFLLHRDQFLSIFA
jgi:insertion element IS1 protein InsB